MLKLPPNFQVGQINKDADCFFNSVAQGLKQLKPELDLTVKSLRLVCKKFAQSQLKKYNSWFKEALKNEDDQITEYIQKVEFTANEIDQKSGAAKLLRLTSPLWGRSEIEGRIICAEYNVQLHVAEKHTVEGEEVWTHRIIDSEGFRGLHSVDYHEVNSLHIINRTDLIYEPILRVKEFQLNNKSSLDRSNDDEITVQEELFQIIKSKKSQADKLKRIIKVFGRTPKLNIDFQGKNNDTCLHIAVRKKELLLIEFFVEKGARTDIKNDKGRSPLDDARRLKRQDIVKILLLHTPQIFVEEQTEPNQKNNGGESKGSKQKDGTLYLPNGELPSKKGPKLPKDEQITKAENSITVFEKRPGTAGMHGQLYEIELLMLILLQAEAKERAKKIHSFHLATNMQEAGDFDDVVFKYKYSEDGVEKTEIIFLQAKHKEAERETRITINTLLSQSEKGDFLLRKYLSSYRKIKELKTKKDHPLFQDSLDRTDFVIYTNAVLKSDNSDPLIKKKTQPKDILHVKKKPEKTYFTLTANDKVKSSLKLSLDHTILVRELAQSVYSGCVDSSKLIFKDYQVSLADEVFEISETNKKEGQLKENFLDGAQDKEFTIAFLEEIKNNQDFSTTFSAKSDDVLKKELRARIIKLPDNFGRAHDNDTKLSLPSKTITDETIEEFLSDLKLFVNQPNVNQLEDTIIKAIIKVFEIEQEDDANLIYSNVHNTITKWWREQKQLKYLTERDKLFNNAKKNLSNMNLVGLAILQAERIKNHGIQFERDQIERLSKLISQKRILNIISHEDAVLLSTVKVHQALEGMNEYKSNGFSCKYIFLSLTSVLRLQNLVTNAFKSEKRDLLVIECKGTETRFTQLYNKLVDTLKLNRRKKIVLITRGQDRLAEQFKHDFSTDSQYGEELDRNNTLADLEMESQTIIKEKQVIFQGIEMELGKLIDESSKHLVDANILSKLINSEEIEVDKIPSDLGEIKYYYINRIFHRRENIRNRCFKATNVQDIFVVSNLNKNELSLLAGGEKVRKFTDNDPDMQNPVRFITLDDDGNVQDNLKRLYTKYQTYNIHWLKKEGCTFRWQETHGSLSNLHEFIDTKNVYEYIADNIIRTVDRVVIVSAEPGMGKSVLLTQLAGTEKKTNPSSWILRINLSDCTKQLNEIDLDKNNLNGTVNFLSEILDLKTVFEKELFKYRVKNQGKIALLFDGFDEISPYYKEKVITLVKILKETKVDKLWITTRPHMKDELEHKLNLLSYTLKPISVEEQKNFLKEFWVRKLGLNVITNESRFNIYIGELLEVLSHSMADEERDFTGIPLQIRMLAEVYQDQFREFYNSGQTIPNFPSKLNLLDLYESFIDKKYNIYWLEKNKADLTLVSVSEIYERYYSKFILQHQLLALQVLFSKREVNLILFENEKQYMFNFKKEVINGFERTGIINQNFNRTLNFIHRTFAEYFSALWLADNQERREVKYLLQVKLFNRENRVLRNFFDRILAKDQNEIHTAVLNFDIKKVAELSSDLRNRKVDKGGRTALHLAAAYGFSGAVKVLLSNDAIGIRTRDKVFGWRPLSYADKGNHWCVMELLLQRGAIYNDMFSTISKIHLVNREGETLLHEAASRGLIKFSQFLIQNKANINTWTYRYLTPLHYAAEGGYLDVVKLFIEKGAKFNSKNKYSDTVLLYAAIKGNWDVVKFLIEKGADFKYKNANGNTVLHYAAKEGNFDLVKLLIKKGADLKCQNEFGNSALYYAACNKHWDVVKLIIEKGANLKYRNHDGNAVLHYAAKEGQLDVVKLLLKKGAYLNFYNTNSSNVLYYATYNKHCDEVELLIKKGTDLKNNGNDFDTVLHSAAFHNHWDIVKFLIERGADFTCQDTNGNTVVDYAERRGNLDVIQLIIEKEAHLRRKYGNTSIHFNRKMAQSGSWSRFLQKTRKIMLNEGEQET